MRRRSIWMLTLVCVAACGGDEEAAPAQSEAETVAPTTRAVALTPAQALSVLSAVSAGAAEAAAAALPAVELAELRRLLTVVRADHEALQAELRAIADSLQLTAEEHAAAARVRHAAQTATPDSAARAAGLPDTEVLQRQVEMQGALLAVLDSTVLPGLEANLLGEYARAMRPTVAAHLQRAHQIETLLRNRPAPPAPAPRPASTPAPAAVDTTPVTEPADTLGGN